MFPLHHRRRSRRRTCLSRSDSGKNLGKVCEWCYDLVFFWILLAIHDLKWTVRSLMKILKYSPTVNKPRLSKKSIHSSISSFIEDFDQKFSFVRCLLHFQPFCTSLPNLKFKWMVDAIEMCFFYRSRYPRVEFARGTNGKFIKARVWSDDRQKKRTWKSSPRWAQTLPSR